MNQESGINQRIKQITKQHETLYGKHGGISQNRSSLPERGKTFDLTLEKQVKIRESLEKAFTLSHFQEILNAVSIKVPPCL